MLHDVFINFVLRCVLRGKIVCKIKSTTKFTKLRDVVF